ncbi:hypothetical protein D3C71_2239560 [compost metagenome]
MPAMDTMSGSMAIWCASSAAAKARKLSLPIASDAPKCRASSSTVITDTVSPKLAFT